MLHGLTDIDLVDNAAPRCVRYGNEVLPALEMSVSFSTGYYRRHAIDALVQAIGR